MTFWSLVHMDSSSWRTFSYGTLYVSICVMTHEWRLGIRTHEPNRVAKTQESPSMKSRVQIGTRRNLGWREGPSLNHVVKNLGFLDPSPPYVIISISKPYLLMCFFIGPPHPHFPRSLRMTPRHNLWESSNFWFRMRAAIPVFPQTQKGKQLVNVIFWKYTPLVQRAF